MYSELPTSELPPKRAILRWEIVRVIYIFFPTVLFSSFKLRIYIEIWSFNHPPYCFHVPHPGQYALFVSKLNPLEWNWTSRNGCPGISCPAASAPTSNVSMLRHTRALTHGVLDNPPAHIILHKDHTISHKPNSAAIIKKILQPKL